MSHHFCPIICQGSYEQTRNMGHHVGWLAKVTTKTPMIKTRIFIVLVPIVPLNVFFIMFCYLLLIDSFNPLFVLVFYMFSCLFICVTTRYVVLVFDTVLYLMIQATKHTKYWKVKRKTSSKERKYGRIKGRVLS